MFKNYISTTSGTEKPEFVLILIMTSEGSIMNFFFIDFIFC